jgi:Manganese containing catalase
VALKHFWIDGQRLRAATKAPQRGKGRAVPERYSSILVPSLRCAPTSASAQFGRPLPLGAMLPILILDLLHNFFLENGARIHKLQVYETVNDPVSREVCGYLLVRGGVHAYAHALALKQLTGVDMTKMLPVPNIPTEKFPEARRYLQESSHRRLYRFSPKDYAEISAIWGNGEQALPGDPATCEKIVAQIEPSHVEWRWPDLIRDDALTV